LIFFEILGDSLGFLRFPVDFLRIFVESLRILAGFLQVSWGFLWDFCGFLKVFQNIQGIFDILEGKWPIQQWREGRRRGERERDSQKRGRGRDTNRKKRSILCLDTVANKPNRPIIIQIIFTRSKMNQQQQYQQHQQQTTIRCRPLSASCLTFPISVRVAIYEPPRTP